MHILVLANNDGGLYKFRRELLEKLCEDNTVTCSVPESDGYIEKIEDVRLQVNEPVPVPLVTIWLDVVGF